MNLVANEIYFVVVEFWLYSYKLPGNIHALFVYLWRYSCIITQVFMPYWNFEYNGTSGRWYGQGPATKVTHLGLNRPQFFQ